jgi:hypothetical protein
MTSTDLDLGQTITMRPKSLRASSLLRRALLGLTILVMSTVFFAVLYDASISKASNDTSRPLQVTGSPAR